MWENGRYQPIELMKWLCEFNGLKFNFFFWFELVFRPRKNVTQKSNLTFSRNI